MLKRNEMLTDDLKGERERVSVMSFQPYGHSTSCACLKSLTVKI